MPGPHATPRILSCIDFDQVTNGTVVNATYSGSGVTLFSLIGPPPAGAWPHGDVYARKRGGSPGAHSGKNVMSITKSGSVEFDVNDGRIEARFQVPQLWVSVMAIGQVPNAPEIGKFGGGPHMVVLDGSNVSTVVYPAGSWGTWQQLSYSSSSSRPGITRVQFYCLNTLNPSFSILGCFDDLCFGNFFPFQVVHP